MGRIEERINSALQNYPELKRRIKRSYQRVMCMTHKNAKKEGELCRITPEGQECFFGYYDKSPWDITDRYMLCIRVKDASKFPAPDMPAEILLIDTENDNKIEVLAVTHTWNVQQGCMLQWLGPDFNSKIIYNDEIDNKYCSIILDIVTKEKKVLARPVYAVAESGKIAFSLDFSRLHRLRPGYGYSNLPDIYEKEKCPDTPCIEKLDLDTNESVPLLTYKELKEYKSKENMKDAVHKVNHIMVSPSGQRIMFLHRWMVGKAKYSRLITMNADGTDHYVLSDDNMVSHCCWKNDNEILGWESKAGQGIHYYLMEDCSDKYQLMWEEELRRDGHPSYSPNREWLVTDCYPDKIRMASVFLVNLMTNEVRQICRVYEPFKYDNETRCDLHPRWDRKGNRICIDGAFEGYRGMYILQLDEFMKK